MLVSCEVIQRNKKFFVFLLFSILIFKTSFVFAQPPFVRLNQTNQTTVFQTTVPFVQLAGRNISFARVNSSDFWDNLDTPADIAAGDLTDDGTYILSSDEGNLDVNRSDFWDNLDTPADFLLSMFTGASWIDEDLDLNGNNITNVGWGTFETINITGTSYFNDNIHLKDNKKAYFGDADDVSLVFNGSDYLVTGEVGSPTLYFSFSNILPLTPNVGDLGTTTHMWNDIAGRRYSVASPGLGTWNLDHKDAESLYIRASSSGKRFVRIRNSGAGKGSFFIEDGDLILNSSRGLVGIGTDSPSYSLDVKGNVSLNDTLYVLNNGNVGIGTTTPNQKLTVIGNVNITGSYCNQSNCYNVSDFLTGGAGENPFDQDLNTTSNVTFDNLNLSGRGMFFGGIDETINYTVDNVRLGVYSSTPRLLFENGEGNKWQIDHGGTGLRFYREDYRVTMRVNTSGVRLGESGYRKNLIVWGGITTKDPAGGGGNLNVTGNTTTSLYFIGDGSLLTNLNIGTLNSSSWNRSGTNVALANTGDLVGIGTNDPNTTLSVMGNISFDTGLYDFIVSGWENNYALYTDGTLGSTGFGIKPNDAFARIQVANSLAAGVGLSTIIQEDTYSTTDATSYPIYLFRKSDTNTIGSKVQTDDGDYLGRLGWMGVDAGNNFDYGAMIQVYQKGAADSRVPTQMEFRTFTDTGQNENQLLLDGATGYVGIGTDSPTHKLNVVGDVNFTGTIYSNLVHVFGLATEIFNVSVGGVWYNITMNRSHADNKGFAFSADNITIIIPHDGHYTLTFGMGIIDDAASPDAHVGMRIELNSAELKGSYIEADTHKKDSDTWLEHTTHAELSEDDEIRLQYISDDTSVMIKQDDTYATQGFSAFGYIREVLG